MLLPEISLDANVDPLVHSKQERAQSLYQDFGFQPSSTSPCHLFRLLEDRRGMAGNKTLYGCRNDREYCDDPVLLK